MNLLRMKKLFFKMMSFFVQFCIDGLKTVFDISRLFLSSCKSDGSSSSWKNMTMCDNQQISVDTLPRLRLDVRLDLVATKLGFKFAIRRQN